LANAPLVTISDRNFDKTVHAFFSFNINEPITLQQVQVMASLALRYTQISVLMKPSGPTAHVASSPIQLTWR
jgi:hypothetical protein